MISILRADPDVRRLAGGWLLLALVALALSTACALLLVAARAPLPAGLAAPDTLFRSALVLHVGLAVVVWFLCCAAALWTLAARAAATPWRWAALVLAWAGVACMMLPLLAGGAAPVLANYVPVLDSPVYLLGLAWFFIGVALCGAGSVKGMVTMLRRGQPEVWQVAAALSLGAAAIAFAALAASLAARGLPVNAAGFEIIAWGPGHAFQFVHVLLLIGVWTVLGEQALGRPLLGRRELLLLAVLAALPALATPVIYVAWPVDSAGFRRAFTLLMSSASWPAAAVLAFIALPRLARAGRQAWPLMLSMLLFLLGCGLGAAIRSESTMVPAHYHGTVGAVTLAYMALAYSLLEGFGLAAPQGRLARRQPLIYGTGLLMLASALAWSGWLGVPRKTVIADGLAQHPSYVAAMALVGIGGFLAVGGAALFVCNMLRAMRGRPIMAAAMPHVAWRRAAAFSVVLAAGSAGVSGWLLKGQVDPAQRPALHAAEKRQEEIRERFTVAASLLNEHRYEEAATELHRVLELAPRMPEAHVNMGFAMLGLQRYAAARDFFDGATELRPNQANAYYGLALALEGLQDVAGALGAMRSYVHLNKNADDPWLRKANAAIWEWEDYLGKTRAAVAKAAAVPETGKEALRYPIREKSLN